MAVKGLKSTSSIIAISGGVAEVGKNTFTQNRIDLQLNPLDNEVFVVVAIDMNLTPPDMDITKDSTNVSASLSTTSRTTLGTLAQSSVLAEAQERIVNDAAGAGPAVSFSRKAGEAPDADLPYLSIIATNDFFAQVEGRENKVEKGFTFRVWGYRAQADASQYAALVQSEVLSN
tara:strand:- start:219 stop:740 length:522 start_codon:yes stop_codon:yes gene_type:complete